MIIACLILAVSSAATPKLVATELSSVFTAGDCDTTGECYPYFRIPALKRVRFTYNTYYFELHLHPASPSFFTTQHLFPDVWLYICTRTLSLPHRQSLEHCWRLPKREEGTVTAARTMATSRLLYANHPTAVARTARGVRFTK